MAESPGNPNSDTRIFLCNRPRNVTLENVGLTVEVRVPRGPSSVTRCSFRCGCGVLSGDPQLLAQHENARAEKDHVGAETRRS